MNQVIQKARPAELMGQKEAAEFLNIKAETLQSWRSTRRYDLPFVKIGRLAKYRLSDLQAFIERHMVA